MKTFKNGWVMFASKRDSGLSTSRVIMAVDPRPEALHPYVVAHYHEGDDEWYWGTYHAYLLVAVEDWGRR